MKLAVMYDRKIKPIHLIILVFFFTNLIILTAFPFVHSDEAWLSGLSRKILEEKNPAVTEPFFNLYPRHPHAVKILFHLLQIILMKLMGYSIFTFRLLSLLAGTAVLYLFYQLARKYTASETLAVMGAVIFGLDIQFLYASHLARQEIILLLILLTAFSYFLYRGSCGDYSSFISVRQDLILGLILGAAIGVHPNSFVIALPFILIYTHNLCTAGNVKLRHYLAFGGTLLLIALIFVLLSLTFDPDFLSNYSSYGESLGVFSSIFTKIDRLDYFYQKLFYGVSGTYYTPPVKLQFIVFALALFYGLFRLFFRKDRKVLLLFLMLLGINLGYVIIGRYNQTGIIFIFPFCYLLVLHLLSKMKKKQGMIIAALLLAALTLNTTTALIRDSHFNYDDYLTEIARAVNKDDRVLANLNAGYYFASGKLLDYRNLSHLAENQLSFAEYIADNHIKYIIYPQEMDFIYKHRPVWNILYGNPYPYYQEMNEFLDRECRLIHSFTSSTYGMRIARYIGTEDWTIKIYRVE